MGKHNRTWGADEAYQEALRRIEGARRKRATRLDLAGLGLSAVPPEIGKLTALTGLRLQGNQLTTLPPEIGKLSALTGLYLQYNQLTTLPPEIGKLSALTELYLDRNQLTTLPPEIGKLTTLTRLDLEGNQLTTLPPEIGKLTALTELHLQDNQLTTLPPEIGKLTALTRLDLEGNQLTTLPPEIGKLTALTELHLQDNQLTTLPSEMLQLTELQRLFLHNNDALGLAPELLGPAWSDVAVGNDSPAVPAGILRYYFRLRPPAEAVHTGGTSARPLNEAKILVVGEPGVGKTALVHWLVHNKQLKNPEWTKGIRIEDWAIPADTNTGTKEIGVHIWDFGGQEIMQATHQFFLTERSLYLLVLDSRENEEQGKIRYWLDKIRAFGGDSPVIVVLNKRDQGSYEPDENRLRKDYPANLLDPFVRTACKKGDTIEAGANVAKLRKAMRARVRQLENVRQPVPAVYFKAKAAFERKSGKLKRMERSAFDALCRKSGLTDEIDRNTLLRYLKSLGSLFHYERPGRDHKTLVLDPVWLTGGVYKIITDLELRERGDGILTPKDVPRIFGQTQGYPRDARQFILDMMEGDPFELCFRIPDTDDHRLIPELLPSSEPDHGIEPQDSLNLEYHYRYLPGGLIPRFVVRMHNVLSPKDYYWRNGVVLRIDERRVLVRGVRESHKVYVSVQGREPAARRALAVVRHNLGMVHGAMKHLQVAERVPLPDQPEITVSYQYLVELELDEGPLYEWRPEGAKRKYTVRELLDGIEEYRIAGGQSGLRGESDDPGESDVRKRKPMKQTEPLVTRGGELFISYAYEDNVYRDEVRKLAGDLRAWGIDAWIDQYIELPGPEEGWPLWMERRIEKAEAVLVVCGPTYLRRIRKEEQPGVGHGATWEGHLVNQHLYNSQTINRKFVPVLLRKDFATCIPTPLQAFNHYKLYEPDGFERLYRALTGQPRVLAPPLGKPRDLSSTS